MAVERDRAQEDNTRLTRLLGEEQRANVRVCEAYSALVEEVTALRARVRHCEARERETER
jgi:hypothetical protein